MDAKEYISSGILELYVMSALSPEEMKEVEKMAASHSEVREEISRIQEALNDYAVSHSRNQRPSLRAEILKAAGNSSADEKPKVIDMRSSQKPLYRFLAAASVVFLGVSVITIISLYAKLKEAEEKYASLTDEKNVLTENYNLAKNTYDKTMSAMSVMRDQNASMITLHATDSTKNYMAHVFWNHKTHNAFIDVLSLPMPAADKQYQLWALEGGKPVDAGVFNMNNNSGMQQMKTIMHADAWAVTLEPMGGSAVPTMNQMYLLSKG